MKTLTSRSGRIESYDRLMLATGSDPFIIPVPGAKLPGVVTFRDMDDVAAMLRAADESRNAVVIGGGLLGLEAAHGLSRSEEHTSELQSIMRSSYSAFCLQ